MVKDQGQTSNISDFAAEEGRKGRGGGARLSLNFQNFNQFTVMLILCITMNSGQHAFCHWHDGKDFQSWIIV